MADLLLELRSEEIPARMQKGARAELEKLFRRELDAAGVVVDDVTVWSTPRRLALIAKGLPTEIEAVREEAKGPPVGAPDQAVDGFCRKNGVTREQLEERDVKGRSTYFAVIEKPGQAVADLLAAAIPAIIRDFSWPKSMRWGEASLSSESLKWVRPLSGIVALLDGEVVPCLTDGLASGRETVGHRFHGIRRSDPKSRNFGIPVEAFKDKNPTVLNANGMIEIASADDYARQLADAHVMVNHEAREDEIRIGAMAAAKAAGLTLVEDEGLVVENAGLTEWPVPLLGRFDESFLDVPPEVIQLTARVNQKYFVCSDAAGKLANAFICTSNIAAADPAVVVDGNRKVLAARLADARFFWELDQKKTLEEHAKGLERITFHEKLGTVADKVDRVAKLARWLVGSDVVTPAESQTAKGQPGVSSSSAQTPEMPASAGMTKERLADLAEQAARLCKADLVTEMVGEFPELQGLMGGYYAEKEGLPREVSDAIRDHYKPVGQGDDVPTAPVTVAVSLADKLDTLAGFFLKEMSPTGSKDPFALRRAAIGTIELLDRNTFRLPLASGLSVALALHLARESTEAIENIVAVGHWLARQLGKEPSEQALEDATEGITETFKSEKYVRRVFDTELTPAYYKLMEFFADRLKVQQREAGVRHDLIDAVFALGGEDDLVRLLARVKALQSFVETDNGTNLLAGYKRAANILKKEDYQVTPAQAGVQSGEHDQAALDRADGPSTTPGIRRNDEGVAATGEEDPLALAGKPEFDDAFRAQGNLDGKSLSYSPEPAEKALIDALESAAPKAASAIEAEDFEAAMAALATLRVPIDAFFDQVTVNDDDPAKRTARLALLARFRDAVHRVADFSRIEG